jgi:hypothetical protein
MRSPQLRDTSKFSITAFGAIHVSSIYCQRRLPKNSAGRRWLLETDVSTFDSTPHLRVLEIVAVAKITQADTKLLWTAIEPQFNVMRKIVLGRNFGSIVGDIFYEMLVDRKFILRAQAFGDFTLYLSGR